MPKSTPKKSQCNIVYKLTPGRSTTSPNTLNLLRRVLVNNATKSARTDQDKEDDINTEHKATGEVELLNVPAASDIPQQPQSSTVRPISYDRQKNEIGLAIYVEPGSRNLFSNDRGAASLQTPVNDVVTTSNTSIKPVEVNHVDHVVGLDCNAFHHRRPVLNPIRMNNIIHRTNNLFAKAKDGDVLQTAEQDNIANKKSLEYSQAYIRPPVLNLNLDSQHTIELMNNQSPQQTKPVILENSWQNQIKNKKASCCVIL